MFRSATTMFRIAHDNVQDRPRQSPSFNTQCRIGHKFRIGHDNVESSPPRPPETYFFTDVEDHNLLNKTGGHLINSKCRSSHNRYALCCKMAVEYDYYIASQKRWFCHVDDDTYVNVRNLVQLLRQYNHAEDWYLGKPSWTFPVEVYDPLYSRNRPRDRRRRRKKNKEDDTNKPPSVEFWFATGAGFCVSQGLALKMKPYTAQGKFEETCRKINLPDDCTMGFVIYHYLKRTLTTVKKFHSHLESRALLKMTEIQDQITFSYQMDNTTGKANIIDGYGAINPTMCRSLHCYFNPQTKGCLHLSTT